MALGLVRLSVVALHFLSLGIESPETGLCDIESLRLGCVTLNR